MRKINVKLVFEMIAMSLNDDNWLVRRLRREARRTRPSFSETLHDRTCQAIRELDRSAGPLPQARRSWHRRTYVAVAVALLVGISLSLLMWQWADSDGATSRLMARVMGIFTPQNNQAETDNLEEIDAWLEFVSTAGPLANFSPDNDDPLKLLDALGPADEPSTSPQSIVAVNQHASLFDDVADAALAHQQALAVWLYYDEGFSVEEIGQVLGCDSAMVEMMLFDADEDPLLDLVWS
jgi:hypothetical protein